MKVEKGSSLYTLMNPECDDNIRVIPYIEKFLVIHPYAGRYEVNDEQYVSKSVDRRHQHFHPSGDCMKCQRLLYLERDESVSFPGDEPDAHLQCIFKTGAVIHSMLQSWFWAMNELDGFPECVGTEVRIQDDELNIGGYIDAMLRFPGMEVAVPIEIKSINDWGFKYLREPKTEHRMQVATYIMETDSPFGIVLYYNKNTSEMKEFIVEPMDMMNLVMRWTQVLDALDAEDISSLQYGCKKGSKDWERCPAHDYCYREE